MAERHDYDGVALGELAARTGAARVFAFESLESTMDVAHALARAGAEHGTIVLADVQTSGRGRERREWESPAGGVWLTVILRSTERDSLRVLPLRLGLAVANALDPVSRERIGLKWPNDLWLSSGKLGGILVEARWRGSQLDWTAAGMGINVTETPLQQAAALGGPVRRAEVAERVIPAVLAAASQRGDLTEAELAEFTSRDIAKGRELTAPVHGTVIGIDPSGSLLVDTESGRDAVRSGSLVFAESTANGQRPTANGH